MTPRSSGSVKATVMGASVPQPESWSSCARVACSHFVLATATLALRRRCVGEVGSSRVAKSLGSGISGKGVWKTSNFTTGPGPASAAIRGAGAGEKQPTRNTIASARAVRGRAKRIAGGHTSVNGATPEERPPRRGPRTCVASPGASCEVRGREDVPRLSTARAALAPRAGPRRSRLRQRVGVSGSSPPRAWPWALAVVGAWIASRWSVPQSLDLAMYDEAGYLGAGLRLWKGGAWPSLDWGPAYAAWYALFGLLTHDGLGAFWVQWLATDLLVTVLLWKVAARASTSPAAGAVAAGAWLGLPVTLVPFPRVGFFALALVLGASWLEPRRPRWAFAVLCLAAFARPELALVPVAWAIAWAWRAGHRRALTLAAVAIAVALAGRTEWGGGRAWFAFGQHHAVQAAIYEGGDLGPRFLDWASLAQADFPGVTSLGQALRTAPAKIAMHVARNGPLLLTALSGARQEGLPDVLGSLVSLGLVAAVLWSLRARLPLPTPLLASVVLVLPALVILPKGPYLLPVLALGLVAAAGLLAPWLGAGVRAGVLAGGLVAVLVGVPIFTAGPPRQQGYLEAVREVAPVLAGRASPVHLWSAEGSFCPYFGVERCLDVTLAPHEPLAAQLARHQVDAVLATASLGTGAPWKEDAELQAFLAAPERFGFHRAPEVSFVALYLRGD